MPYPDEAAPTNPSGRLLRLLSLLQIQPAWSGRELADRLGVTTRTVRRDVDRLRNLGYPVDAVPGPDGGYRLGPGAKMPPLLLDDDEATAATIALRGAANGPVGGIEEAALSALSKLDRVLPPHLRARVDALRDAMVYLGTDREGIDPDLLVIAAHASAGRERLRLSYRDRRDRLTERRIEPYRLVCTGRRWYLVARDVEQVDDDAGGWRTFRVDRIIELANTGHRFTIDSPPDAAALVTQSISSMPVERSARIRFLRPATQMRALIPLSVGPIDPDGDEASILSTGADQPAYLVGHLVSLDVPFEVLDPPELRAQLKDVGDRLVAAHDPAAT